MIAGVSDSKASNSVVSQRGLDKRGSPSKLARAWTRAKPHWSVFVTL